MNTTKGRISELEDMLIETSKVEKQKKKRLKYWSNIQELWDDYKKYNEWWEENKKKKNGLRKWWLRVAQSNIRHQTKDPGSSVNTKMDK